MEKGTLKNSMSEIEYSIVIPAHNEVDNITRLVQELHQVFAQRIGLASCHYEIIVVDDGSIDGPTDLKPRV